MVHLQKLSKENSQLKEQYEKQQQTSESNMNEVMETYENKVKELEGRVQMMNLKVHSSVAYNMAMISWYHQMVLQLSDTEKEKKTLQDQLKNTEILVDETEKKLAEIGTVVSLSTSSLLTASSFLFLRNHEKACQYRQIIKHIGETRLREKFSIQFDILGDLFSKSLHKNRSEQHRYTPFMDTDREYHDTCLI